MLEKPDTIRFPFYAKMAFIFISLFACAYILTLAQEIIIPLIYATILAILLNPIVNWLVRRKINKIVSITITVILALLVIAGIAYLIFAQLANMSKSFPEMKEKVASLNKDLVNWFSQQTNIEKPEINEYLTKAKDEEITNFSVGANVLKIGHGFVAIVLIPVYLMMILYYKPLLLEFIQRVFKANNQKAVSEVLTSTKKIIQTYIVGLFIEMIIVAVLNSIGLLIIGIDYAILLGIIGALLNIIPYVGAIIAATIFMFIALLTMSPIYMLYVLVLYLFVQFIDNNFLLPKIVASRVRINALVSIVVVIIGGTVWGIPGMFLAIPLTAILKLIFDHVEGLKPWGFLLGDLLPTVSKFAFGKGKKPV